MQISRHWRLNANRYRLEGFASNGTKSVQARVTVQPMVVQEQPVVQAEKKAQPVAA